MMASISLMATSCYYDELPAEPVPANVSYTTNIQSLFNKNCVGCHKTGSTAPDLSTGNSYAALTTVTNGEKFVIAGNAAGSILYQCMSGTGGPIMPPNGALSASKLALVEKWINDGALNN